MEKIKKEEEEEKVKKKQKRNALWITIVIHNEVKF